MSRHATGSMELKTWEEQPYSEIDGGPKLTRADVITAFQGEIEGEGTKAYLMVYHDDASASFVGLERVVGQRPGRHHRPTWRWPGLRERPWPPRTSGSSTSFPSRRSS